MRSEVMAFVAASQATAQQTRSAVAAAQAAEVALHAASERAHREVTDIADDLFGKKIFDPYLRFASAEDEEAYRRREADRQAYIAEQLAKGTPEGNLNAANATVAQLEDAGAHGADRSPDHAPMLARAKQAQADLSQVALAAERPLTTLPAEPVSGPEEPDAVFASLRAAGVVMPDQTGEGHGVSRDVIERMRGLSQS